MKRQTNSQQEKVLAETIYEISRGLNTARDEDELLQILARPALEAGAIRANLLYIDLNEAGEPEWLEIVAVWQQEGTPPSIPVGTRLRLSEFPFARLIMVSPGEPQLIADATMDERVDENLRNLLAQSGARATAVAPLIQAGRWVGLLVLSWDEPHQFSEQEVASYRALIGLASPAVANRRLVEDLEQMVAERTRELQTFRTLAENAHDGIWILDLEGRMLYANPVEAAVYGYDRPEEMIGLGFPDLAAAEEMERIQATVPIALSEGWRGELLLKRKDGSHFPAELAAFAITDEKGQPVALAGITRDITERKRLEESLEQIITERTQEVAIFKTLAENSLDAIGMADLAGKTTYVNHAFCQLYGYDYESGEVIGLSTTNFMAEEELSRFAEIMPQAMREGWSGEGQAKRKDGSTFEVHLTFFALRDEAGNPISTAAFSRDLTERKRAEEEQVRLQQEIIEAQQRALRELSTPIVPVLEGVLVLPLVGSIDSRRAQQVMEILLEAISRYQAEVVIIDITGVPVVDTGVANHLLQVTRAATLLGSECVLVGISPEVAQTIVSLGVDLSDIDTQANLQSGIEHALKKTGRRIVTG